MLWILTTDGFRNPANRRQLLLRKTEGLRAVKSPGVMNIKLSLDTETVLYEAWYLGQGVFHLVGK